MNVNQEYKRLLTCLMSNAVEISPRGLHTYEIMAHQSVIDMTNPCVCLTGRKLSEAFRFAEAAWILSGDNRVSTIAPFSEKIAQFSDDGHRYFGSYGPKVVDQLSYCAQKLQLDLESRQAVINIWRENPGQTRDVPCTLSLQFLIRQGRLNIVATMRSSDAWLGWPYDVFNFSMIGWAMCLYLRDLRGPGRSEEGLPSPGVLFLTAGSQHLYQTNLTQAEEVLEHGKVFRPRISLPPFEEWVTSSKGQNLVDDFVRDLWILANSAHR